MMPVASDKILLLGVTSAPAGPYGDEDDDSRSLVVHEGRSVWRVCNGNLASLNWSGWRLTVGVGALLTLLTLIANITLLAYSATKPPSENGFALLFQGDCTVKGKISTALHVVINLLSTFLLGASNASAQCLSAPTRTEVDEAHRSGQSLDIGIAGLTNFKYLSLSRKAAWLLLLLSSIPLHLVYNSVIISTTAQNNYVGIITTQAFVEGVVFNKTQVNTTIWQEFEPPESQFELSAIMNTQALFLSDPGGFANLSSEECFNTYDGKAVTQYSNLAVIVNAPEPNLFLAAFWTGLGSAVPLVSSIDTYSLTESPNKWVMYNGSMGVGMNLSAIHQWNVEYCLAQIVQPACTVELLPALLAVVIACNAVKFICMIGLLYGLQSVVLLITVGDAVASFLSIPDPFTEGAGAVFADQIPKREQAGKRVNKHYHRSWKTRYRWFRGASKTRWIATIIACLLMFFVGLCIFVTQVNDYDARNGVDNIEEGGVLAPSAFGAFDQEKEIGFTAGRPIIANILLANAPQLVLSLVYLSYNQLFTSMALSREWTSFAVRRKGLRVTQPRGSQRSTHWLSLPLRFSVPLLIASGILHWLTSESIFLADITFLDYSGVRMPAVAINIVGWSGLPFFFAVLLGSLMILTLLGVAIFRKYDSGIPIVRSSSMAISAACHGHSGKRTAYWPGPEEAEKKLRYGVVEVMSEGVGRVGFSSGEVGRLQDGWCYGKHG